MKKILSLIAIAAFITAVGCGGGSSSASTGNPGGGTGGPDTSTTVGLTLANASLLNDNFANTNNWDFVNGATGSVSNGILTVTANTTEGIAMRLKDSVWTSIGSPTSYYVEMLVKPTSYPGGNNKNIGIASNISSDSSTWYYAAINANSRLQAGCTTTIKGYQNTGDGTSLKLADDLVYYKLRYEYNSGVINFYCNDLYMGKTTATLTDALFLGKALAAYTPGLTYTGSVGVYSSLGSFEVAGVRIGTLTENQSKLVVCCSTDTSLPLFWNGFLRRINNVSSTGMKIDDTVNFVIKPYNASGANTTWTASTTDSSVLGISANSGAFGDTLTVTGKGLGTASIVITNASDSGSKRVITYLVDKKDVYVSDTYTGITSLVYPNIGTTSAYSDGELSITFDSPPTITDNTRKIYIYNYSTNALVDTIRLASDTFTNTTRGTTVLNVGSQRVRISGNVLYIAPHDGVLAYGTQYYVAIPSSVISGTLNGKTFTGFALTDKTWNFTTKASAGVSGTTVTVDGSQSSTANFRTVQAALNYVSTNSATMGGAVIQIQPGTYRELLTFSSTISLTLKGMGSASYGTDVIIQYANGDKVNTGTNYRPLTYFSTTGTLNLVNLTLKNSADKPTYGQAETIYFNNDTGYLVAKNCTFNSAQDTILTKGYNWFYQCNVIGDTDFIWGYAKTSLFESCLIELISDKSFIFQARSPAGSVGYVLFNCTLQADTGTSYFGRSGGDNTVCDNVSIINCNVTGSGTLNTWYSKTVDATTPNPTPATATASAGWKQYGLTASGTPFTVSCANAYTLTDPEYTASWSTRALILGTWAPVEP
jgi:pectate lyase